MVTNIVNNYGVFIRHLSRLDHEWAIKFVHNSYNLFSVQTKVIANYSYKVPCRAISTNLASRRSIISKTIKHYFFIYFYSILLLIIGTKHFCKMPQYEKHLAQTHPNIYYLGMKQIKWPFFCIISCPFIEDRSKPKGIV